MYSLTDLCSLCLINSKTIISVLSQDKDGIVVKNKLEYVLYEIINFKSEILKNICTDCLKGLNYVYKFKQKCLQNLTSLNDFIEKMTVEDSDEFSYCVSTSESFISDLTNNQDEDETMETNNSYSSCEIQPTVKKEPVDQYNETEIPYTSVLEDIRTENSSKPNSECNLTSNNIYIENQTPQTEFVKTEYIEEIDINDPLLSEEENEENSTDANETNKSEETPSLSSLPVKSRERYEHVYQQFEIWCQEKKVQTIDEKLLLTYFEEKSSILKSSTLWSIYSMLRATLSVNKNIDIKKYDNLLTFIRKKAVGHQSKSSSILTKAEIARFLKEADDTTYLLMKVVLIIGISGACRREELTYLQLESIKDMGSFILIELPNNLKTNVRIEFVISTGNIEGLSLISIFRKYAGLRPQRTDNTRFFLGYRNGKCTRQSVGINTIGAIPKKIAEFLKLPNPSSYTGNCFRRSAAALLTNSGGDIVTVKRRGRWR